MSRLISSVLPAALTDRWLFLALRSLRLNYSRAVALRRGIKVVLIRGMSGLTVMISDLALEKELRG
jgi:hypothetical protein